jgi:hypothetical protein
LIAIAGPDDSYKRLAEYQRRPDSAEKKRPDREGPGEVIGSPMTEVSNTELARDHNQSVAGQFI